jgi:drug/metabolite transporter (DMT)-like permease
VGVGLIGILVIAAPALGGGGRLLPYAMLLTAAAAWAVSIVVVRAHRFGASPLALAPWQTLVAATLLCPLAFALEGGPPGIGVGGMASLAYVGPIATAFAYWAVVEAGRRVPARTISMALLATPGLGVLISALALGESVTASLVAGIVLVGAGIRLATTARPGEEEPIGGSRRISSTNSTGTECGTGSSENGRCCRSG